MTESTADDGSDLDRSRALLIEKIYDLVLAPEGYDAFMEDWERHVTALAGQLHDLREETGLVEDPVLESHFNRAFAILERFGRGAAGLPGNGHDSGRAALMLRRDGSVEASGPVDGPFRRVTQYGDLEALLEHDDWEQLKATVAQMRRAPHTGRMMVLKLARNKAAGNGLRFLTAATARDEASGEIAMRIMPLQVAWNAQLDDVLTQSFQLSPSEIRVVEGLAGGHDLNSLAKATGRSLNTVRSQLKSVFQKTRTGSQADLMRIVSVLSSMSPGVVADPVLSSPRPETGRLAVIPLSGGRQIPVHFMGPDDGIPVIFVHGMLDGIAVTTAIHDLLQDLGIRLIAPVRPNFGSAAADDRVKQAPAIFGGDMAELVERLKLERCLVLGHMAGSLYAFAAAAATPAICGVVTVSGGVPIKSARQFSMMAPRQRTVAYTARFTPALLPTVLRAGIAQIDGADAAAFMNALYRPGTADRRLVENPAIASAILDGYRFAVAQGHWAFQADSYHVTRDWSASVRQSDCPVLVMHGAHDPVVNIATVRDFAASLGDRAALSVFPDSGQLLFYAEPRRVLEALAELWNRVG